MKGVLLLVGLVVVCTGHIYSSPPKVTYNYDGSPKYYSLYMSLETGIGASDYLMIIWPFQIYNTLKSEITVNLISYSNNLQVATAQCNPQTATGTLTYLVTLGYAMQPNTWYEVQVIPTKNPTTTPSSELVQVMTVSDFNSNYITYDSNMAFGYINIMAPLASTNTLAVVCNSTSSQATVPASIYSFDVYLTPGVSSSTGGNFTLQIYYDSSAPIMATGTSVIDFSFMGLCQSAATTAAAAVLLYCSISSDLATITFAMQTVTAGQAIRIATSISNPQYYSVRGIKAFWTEFISGRVLENGFQNNALMVNKININTVSPRILLFWGIESTFTDSKITTALPLFKAASSTPNILPYNSFDIGFSFSQTSPITGEYVVTVTVGATGVAEGTIAHNLPAYSGKTVYCYYDTATLVKAVVCKNVGAFISTGYRYFVSGKAYFDSLTSSPISTFGAVAIQPIVYNSAGAQVLTPVLYVSLAGQSTVVEISKELLDTGGYHDITSRKIGNAQVVSYYDDQTLSSTANAAAGFLQGTNSTVGIVPDLGVSQQLLFLLKTSTTDISQGGNSATDFTIEVLFNSYVIGFETTGAGRGLDFVGYLTGSTAWSISGSPCYYQTVVCQKYNNNTPLYNTKSLVAGTNSINWYGQYKFRCGTSYSPVPSPACSSNCASECNMFTGYSLTDQGAAVMAMREVVLPTGYHSSLYADKNLLDFLVVFKQGSTPISYCLINGYTVTGARMQNIKAAIVNYYDSSSSPYEYNKGIRIPMMVRIGGGVLPSESLSATAVGIFFDDNIDSQSFYNSIGTSWGVGCSTGNCNYYPNNGIRNTRMDNWLLSRQVTVFSLPPIQNEFNILVPVTPDRVATGSRAPPKYLTIAFFSQNYSVNTATGLLQPLSVYRLFGPVVTGSISGALSSINGLARSVSNVMNMEQSSNYVLSGYSFSVSLNTTNMYSSPTNNTFTYSTSFPDSFGSSFGAGYTITSFYYNIFASATLSWSSPPANTATTCTLFGYVYNQLVSPGTNAFKNGKWMYAAFCPIDASFNLNSAAANIDFLNPQYPLVFTNGYALQGIITIGYSEQAGYLRAIRHQTNPITTLVRNCTTAKMQPYNPSSSGKQRSTFTLTLPAITMSQNGYSGYSTFEVYIVMPTSTLTSSGISMVSQCDTSNTLLTCAVISAGTNPFRMRFTYNSAVSSTITYLEVNIYASVSGTFNTAADYTVTVYLPQYISSISTYVPFGDTNYFSYSTYCTCTSSFTVGITSFGTTANLNSLLFASAQKSVRSSLSFIFGANSYRDTFYSSTSTFKFNFGFLNTPCYSSYQIRNNFRCLVYEGPNSTSLSLSSAWKSLTLGDFATVTLSPKGEISNPSSIIYKMQCFGGGIPTGSNTTDMTLRWEDSGSTVQSAPSIQLSSFTTITASSSPPTSATLAFDARRFKTKGTKALYSLRVTSPVALTAAARFYFDFHMFLSPYLDHEATVECYIRTTTPMTDSTAQYTYCTFTNWWQLIVWNNLNSITAGTPFYVDIYNVDQPLTANVGGNQKIMVTIDNDNNYSNGVSATAELTDVSPDTTTPSDIKILNAAVTSYFILATQTLTIDFDMLSTAAFTTATSLYVLLPASYSKWITRGQTIPVTYPADPTTGKYCAVNKTAIAGNYATACTFISQRVLRIDLGAVTYQLFSLTLMNLNTPAAVPEGKFNQYRFKLFMAGASQQTVSRFSFTDYSQHLTLTTNPALISLAWNQYSLSVSASLFTLTSLGSQVITVQQGYYSNVVELRQSIFPANFRATITLAISNYAAQFTSLTSLAVTLGKPTAYFRIAAVDATTSPGLYVLQFTKTGDSNNAYTNIPPLTLVVQNTQCALATDANTYTLPVGGMTLPISINAINCIPTRNITFTVSFTGTGNSQFGVNTDLSTLTMTSASPDGRLYFVLKHVRPASGSLVAGNSVTATISIGGPNAAFYASIPAVTLTLVDATTFQTFPTGTALTAPTLRTNTATFQLQCSQASRIYWGLGIYPSILNNQQVDFQARIISAGNGLLTNFTEANDYYGRVYGVLQGSTMQVLSRTLYNLQSNVNYIFKYFCVNQLGHVSDSQSINFTSLNYGAYLMKVEITFRGSINYQQYNDLACSLSQSFIIPTTRVVTEAISTCGNTPFIFYPNSTATVLNVPDSNGWYIYGFYIEPDYTISSDPTNTNIRNQLSLNTQATNIITTTNTYISLPSLVQMQTTDIQIYTAPIMTISSPLSGLTSVVFTASITNMNGFIVIGVLQGSFDSSTMTVPAASDIKSGKFSQSVTLTAVQMIHTTQNYNTTVQFNGLSANTLYSFFYFCTVEDPAITALSSAVSTTSAQTLQMLIIDINHEPLLRALPLVVLALLLLITL